MTTLDDTSTSAEAHHQHRDVSGGRLRPAVFGAMDGLVTNVSLIAGVGGAGGAAAHYIVLAGVAGLVAGAFSMAAGEFISVRSQNELVNAEVDVERRELRRNPRGEQRELAETFVARGVDAELADRVAAQISAHPAQALGLHVREELGVDPDELPSPWTAAGASFVCFAVGALLPLLPYLLGLASLPAAVIIGGAAALAGGGFVAALTGRPIWLGATRQFAVAAIAVIATYGIGHLVGAHIG